jgi:hypothetical protein
MYNLILAVAAANDQRRAAMRDQAQGMMRRQYLFIAQSAQLCVVLASLRPGSSGAVIRHNKKTRFTSADEAW